MNRKRNERIALLGIIGILCFAVVLLYATGNNRKKELTEEIQRWLQEKKGTFVVEQEVVSDTFSDKDIYKIRYGDDGKEYKCSVYKEESKEWIKEEKNAEFYEEAFTELLHTCVPNGYVAKKENQYQYKKGRTWRFEYDIVSKGTMLEKITVHGTEELNGETVTSKTIIRREH